MMKKGASLIWTVMLCGVLTLVISTMALASMTELKASSRMDSSASAFSAAKSGIEWGRYYVASHTCAVDDVCTTVSTQTFTLDTNTKFAVTITEKAVGSKIFIVNSKGTAYKVNRVLEYEINKNESFAYNKLSNQDIVDSSQGSTTFSFADNVSIIFDYWKKTNSDHDIVGFKDAVSPTKSIYVRYNSASDKLELVYSDDLGSTVSPTTISMSSKNNPATQNEDLNYQIKLQYVKNGVLVATVWERTPAGALHCIGSASLDLSGKDLSGLNRFYLPTSSAVVSNIGLNPIRFGTTASSFYGDNFYSKGFTVPLSLTFNRTLNTCSAAEEAISVIDSVIYPGGYADYPRVVELGMEENSSNGCGTPSVWSNVNGLFSSTSGASINPQNGYDNSGYITVDLGQERQISSISFEMLIDYATNSPWQAVYTSRDGITWDLKKQAPFDPWDYVNFVNVDTTFTSTQVRYIKIFQYAGSGYFDPVTHQYFRNFHVN